MTQYDDMTMPAAIAPIDPGCLPDIDQMGQSISGSMEMATVLYDIISTLDTYAPVLTALTKKAMAEELGAYAAALAADLLGFPHGRVTAYVQDNVPASH